MKTIGKTRIKHYLESSLRYVTIGSILSSTAFITAAYSQTPAPGKFAYNDFAYFLDNVGDIFNSDGSVKLLAGTIIGQQTLLQRQTVTKAGGIAGYSASFAVAAGQRSYVGWTDTTNGSSLHQIFNDSSNNNLTQTQLATKILKAVGIDSTQPGAFPQQNETNVIWAQDIEQNTCNNTELTTKDYGCPLYTDNKTQNVYAQPLGYTNAAAAYVALFWAGRVLLPNMTIIPVPASYIQKVGNGGGTGPSWNLPDVLNGNSSDAYLSLLEPVLKIKASLTASQQLNKILTGNVDLLSFLHMVTISNPTTSASSPLIDGFLAQQYSCRPNNVYDTKNELMCTKLNPGAIPGNFSQGDTPPLYDKSLPYAIMSAHDNPNQITYLNTAPLAYPPDPPTTLIAPKTPWPSYYSSCLPFKAGVYWADEDSDLQIFNPTQYLTPTAVSSTLLTSNNSAPSHRSSSFKVSVQVLGGSAGVNGSVTSTNTSISCGSKTSLGCSQSVGAYQTVLLVANPAPARKFLYWTGTDSCKGNNPTCTLTVKADTQVGACFQ